ncbi:MAG: SDR family oxidoreductase [Planctomycetales bacterium]|nr:SDR family oxidoreductase [Planctomycetales bacterium]
MTVLQGKNAIVTGASQGIGAATALALAEAGANVAINYWGPDEPARDVAAQCEVFGVRTKLIPADVARQSEVERMVRATVDDFGGIDLAVSNAAYSDRELFHEADMAGFERTIQVTMWGAFYLVRAVSQEMIRSKTAGSLVVVGSPHAWVPVPGSMAYNMAKAAITHMAMTAATELVADRIRVNVIHPGWIDTPGERKFFSEEKIQTMGQQLPWGRLGTPAEIARGILFLCDPASDYITGTSLVINGGLGLPVRQMHRPD